MLKLCRVSKVKVFFLCWYTFLILANINLFEFSAAILEKGLLLAFGMLTDISNRALSRLAEFHVL